MPIIRSPSNCRCSLWFPYECGGGSVLSRPRLRTLQPPHSYGNQRLQRQFDGLLMMGVVVPKTCWAVSVRQGNKFYDWLLHLVGCFIRMNIDVCFTHQFSLAWLIVSSVSQLVYLLYSCTLLSVWSIGSLRRVWSHEIQSCNRVIGLQNVWIHAIRSSVACFLVSRGRFLSLGSLHGYSKPTKVYL